jgi:hypothetical protein
MMPATIIAEVVGMQEAILQAAERGRQETRDSERAGEVVSGKSTED